LYNVWYASLVLPNTWILYRKLRKTVFALDIAIILKTPTAFATAVADGELTTYGFDPVTGYGYIPYIPPDYNIGNNLNIATVYAPELFNF
jgi:hypothetical protein